MKPATVSWCTEIVVMSSERSYSASMKPILPCPHSPNAYGTFSWIR